MLALGGARRTPAGPVYALVLHNFGMLNACNTSGAAVQMTSPEHAMYYPPYYAAEDPRALVVEFPFAQVVTATPGGPFATSTPVYFETDDPADMRMVSHLSRANPHAGVLRTGDRVLAIFEGPHAYISASWYRERPTVPTWNYLTAQVRGTLEVMDDAESLVAVLRRTAEMAEGDAVPGWTIEDAPPGRMEMLLPRIRAFRIHVTRIDGAAKLAQFQPAEDRRLVWEALEKRGSPDDLQIAERMRQLDGVAPR